MQFWEDVDEGLNDIEAFYLSSKGMDIDRVRRFTQSASGQVPPPIPSVPGHQPSEEHIDGLTAKPIWNVHTDDDDNNNQNNIFPWAAELEASSHVIIDEWNTFYQGQLQKARDSNDNNNDASSSATMILGDSAWQNQIMGPGWSAVRLQRLGVWNTNTCRTHFPQTYELLRNLAIPLAVRGVCFARQEPQTGVLPHSDGRNFILTAHLGLDVPDGCWMKVGTEECTWEVGKLTIIDTSFEHSTGNPGDSERLVLIIDFWHPELTEAERAALEFVYDLRNKFENGNIPFRKPRSLQAKEEDIGALWSKLTGGGS
ncbi:peptide-aspartate beta-dioxygenase [Fragilaria crotonensis]|nr:peptide-aspartate beta-dioxygenase [Fragilaria crotonensis]